MRQRLRKYIVPKLLQFIALFSRGWSALHALLCRRFLDYQAMMRGQSVIILSLASNLKPNGRTQVSFFNSKYFYRIKSKSNTLVLSQIAIF
jgi:hypothetical protein